jgi:hypothetical protein
MAKDYIKENGFEADEVIAVKQTKKTKPGAGSGSRAVSGSKPSEDGDDTKRDDAPKTVDEWKQNQERFITNAVKSLS